MSPTLLEITLSLLFKEVIQHFAWKVCMKETNDNFRTKMKYRAISMNKQAVTNLISENNFSHDYLFT